MDAADPQLTTPSVPRADVWVFDPAQLGATLGGVHACPWSPRHARLVELPTARPS